MGDEGDDVRKQAVIHSQSGDENGCVMLACKQPFSLSDIACEAGAAPSIADRSIGDAAYVRSTDGLRSDGCGAVIHSREQ